MQELIKKILNISVHAPSGDNSQPWKFVVEGNCIQVFSEPEKDHSKLNVKNRGTYIACGALLENIKVSSAHFGYEAKITFLPDARNAKFIAKIDLIHDSKYKYFEGLFEYIEKRCTNRKSYFAKEILPKEIEVLKSCVPSNINSEPYFKLLHADDVKYISSFVSNGEYVMIHNKVLRKILTNNVRWDDREEKDFKSGLYLKTLELLPQQEFVFKLLKSEILGQVLIKLGLAKLIAKDNARKYSKSPSYGVLYLQKHSSVNYIKTGMAMQRIWIMATSIGLSVHLTTGLIYLNQGILDNSAEYLSEEEIQLVTLSIKQIEKRAKVPRNSIVILFRLGYSDYPSAKSSKKVAKIQFNS